MLPLMKPIITSAIPILPAADVLESLKWWTDACGFKETFRDTTPPTYAGINRDEANLHLAGMTEAMYAEYQKRGGKVHPNGPLQTKPWGTKEFGAIDPNGVCVTFQE